VKAAWLLAASILCGPILAGDCPPGCTESKVTATKKPAAKKKPVPVATVKPVPGPVGPKGDPGPPGPKGDKGEAGERGAVVAAKSDGYWGGGVGPIFNAGWGAQAAGSYNFPNGLELELSVNHIDHDGAWCSSGHDSNGRPVPCVAHPTSPSPWGGGFLVKYHWK